MGFETQLAFLSTKAVQIRALHWRGRSIVLDRSLSEDIDVFAKYFHEHGDIDDRAYATYTTLAEHFLLTLPQPDLVIYVGCRVAEAFRRIEARERTDRLHTREHVAGIADLYTQWLSEQHQTTVLQIDSEEHDFRDPLVVQAIAAQVERRLVPGDQQLSLFEQEAPSPIIIAGSTTGVREQSTTAVKELAPHPVAYLAAPFRPGFFRTGEQKFWQELLERFSARLASIKCRLDALHSDHGVQKLLGVDIEPPF